MIDLKFDHVSKKYRIRQEEHSPGNEAGSRPRLRLLGGLRQRSQDFWAVRDVSFTVERGEALGIIGHNGAGKSTILKLLSGITAPTGGEITINGRLAALIEIGSGFHPELTGRENIFLNGSILGMRRREIGAKLDSIIDFAGVRAFIDVPVKRYSSGMYVRLGFSVAAHLDPDILLLDEVLAVGDVGFQEKCLERISELQREGKTIIFISHDLSAVEQLCERALLMQQGRIIATGSPREVIARYRQSIANFVSSSPPPEQSAGITRRAEITSLRFFDANGCETNAFATGEPATVRVECSAREGVPDAVLGVFFLSAEGQLVCNFSSMASQEQVEVEPGRSVYEFYCPAFGLQPGTYFVDAAIERRNTPELVDWQYRCALLLVNQGKPVRGGFYMPHQFFPVPGRDFEGEEEVLIGVEEHRCA
jgi:ABC-type polysaccharide/polyol phosphate transport system ATPase subunit